MNENPWWAYPDEDAWKSPDETVVVRALWSTRQAVTIEVRTPTGSARALWDPQVQMLSMLDGAKLEKPTFAAVKEYVASAAELHELSEPTQFVLDLLVDTLSHDALVSLKVVRQQLIRTYGVERERATTIVEGMHPRFVALRGDYVTLQPLGLLRSKLAEDSKLVITRCLERMKAAYDENADISSIGLETALGDVDEDRKRLALREIHLFKLASNITNDGKGTWHVPADIEELWAENVTTLDALWRFAKQERKVQRPWPGALVRGDWKDDRIEKYLEESVRRGSAVSLVRAPDPPAETPEPESQAPEYKLPRLEVTYGEKLGSGAFGTVWQGTDKLLDRTIAVKFLTSTADSLDEEALIREARSLAKIAHPNLVTVYSAAWLRHPDNGLVAPAITMELLAGVELEKWRERQHERHEVLKVASGILAGIYAMHDAGLHHGDLHLQNVMVLSDATAKLIDWRYQDTFLQRSTAYRHDLVEADKRRAVDLVLGMLEKQGLTEEAMQIRRTPDFASVQAAVAALRDAPQATVQQPPSTEPAPEAPPDNAHDDRFLPTTTILKSRRTDLPVDPVKWIITLRPENAINAPRNELIDALKKSLLTVDTKDGRKKQAPQVLLGQKTLRDGGAAWRHERSTASNEWNEEQLVVAAHGAVSFQRAMFRDDQSNDLLLVSFLDLSFDAVMALMLGYRYGQHLHLDASLKASLLLKVPVGYSRIVAHFGNGIVQATSPMSTSVMFEPEVEGNVVLGKSVDLDAISLAATRLLNYAAAAFARDDADALLSIDPGSVRGLCERLNGS